MKILQLIQKPQRRGAEIFAAQLANHLQAIGHQVLLVSIFEGKANLPFSGEYIQLNRPIKRRLYDWSGWGDFAKTIIDFQPDIIQANAADTLKFAVFSKLLFKWNQPIIYRNANQMGDFIKGYWHRRFNQFLLNRVEAIASVSQASQEDLLKTFRFPSQQCKVIPIGIVPEEIEEKRKAAATYQFKQPFLLQIGGLVPEKDPLGMLHIFDALEDKSINLVFVGSGPLESKLLKEIQRLSLQDRVQLIPNQTNIFPILSQATALVMPSKIEGLPAAILEAMYCKVPVIAYGVGGIPEVLTKDKINSTISSFPLPPSSSYCISPGDQQAFISAIHHLLQLSPDQKQLLLTKAQLHITTHYTLPQITNQFQSFYQEVLLPQQPSDGSITS